MGDVVPGGRGVSPSRKEVVWQKERKIRKGTQFSKERNLAKARGLRGEGANIG